MKPAKPLVVKVSGKVGDWYDAVAADVGELVDSGRDIVLVHGGSAVIDDVTRSLGMQPRIVTSPSGISGRFTAEADLDPILMACAGLINKRLVLQLFRHGVTALGLSGLDGGLLRGTRKDTLRVIADGRVKLVRGNHSGRVDHVDGGLLRLLLDRDLVPVVAPVALSLDGKAINVDADRAAAAIAWSLRAPELVLLTDVPGLIDGAHGEVVRSARAGEIEHRLLPMAGGRMHVKLAAAAAALEHGVARVVIASAFVPSPVTAALSGGGTHLLREDAHGPG